MQSVRGVVLAGTYPRNHSALDRLSPRPLLPVAQQPLITYALRWLEKGGILDATICANAATRAIRDRLDQQQRRLHLTYAEDWTPRGPAGCVRDAAVAADARTFVVADATTVPVVDPGELLAHHRTAGALLTVVVDRDDGTPGQANRRLRPAGIYVFDRAAVRHISAHGFQDIKEGLVPRLYDAGEHVSTFVAEGASPRVVDDDSYLALDAWAVVRTARELGDEAGCRLSGEPLVHPTARVDPSARLVGPVMLGPNVSVSSGATVVGPSSVGAGTTLGRNAVVSRSVVWNGCTVGDGAFVHRSMLADGSRVSSRATVYSEMRTATSHRHSPAGPVRTRRQVAHWASLGAPLSAPLDAR